MVGGGQITSGDLLIVRLVLYLFLR